MINMPGEVPPGAAHRRRRSALPFLIIAIVVIVLAVAVGTSVALVRHSKTHPRTETTKPRTYGSKSCPATLTPGTDWHDLSDSSYAKGLDLMVGNELREEYVSVHCSTLSTFGDDYTEFVKDSESAWRKQSIDHKINIGNRRKVNGNRVHRLTLIGEVTGDRYFYWVDLREGAQGYYQVVGWTPVDEHQQHKRDVTGVMGSFFEL